MARKQIKEDLPKAEEPRCLTCSELVFGKWDNRKFILEKRDDPMYDWVAIPCPNCNPNPPRLEI